MNSPRSAKRKPLPEQSSRTALATRISAPSAFAAMRAARMTVSPKRSPSSWIGSPAFRPTRIVIGSAVRLQRVASDLLVLAEDVAPLFVTQTVHHRGVTDDVGEEDGPKGGVGPRGGALSYGAPTDELHDRREGEAEVLPGRDVRTREREEARAFD